jgi:uncharacterized membrane protein
MATVHILSGSRWRLRPKYLLFGLVGLMMLTVIYRDRVLVNPYAPIWEHYLYFKWWLLPHGVAGALALFLGPLQFSDKLRRQFLPWHRVIGRIYVCGVAVAAPVGIWIEYIKFAHAIAPLRLLIATIGFGTLLVLTTGIGFFMARRRNIRVHRMWMTRSYAVAIVFLESRFVDQIPWLAKLWERPATILEMHHISDLWVWIVLSLTAAELLLRSEKLLKTRSPVRDAMAPVVGA